MTGGFVLESSSSRRRRRLWKFATAQFGEATRALRVNGHPVTLESKPLEVVHELVLRAGEVVRMNCDLATPFAKVL